MKYEIYFTDGRTGSKASIDIIEKEPGYTADQYIEDCKENAD